MRALLPRADRTPDALDALGQLAVLRLALEDEVLRCVDAAFQEGHTWEAIGVALRCSAQAVHKRYADKVAGNSGVAAASAMTETKSRHRLRQSVTSNGRRRAPLAPSAPVRGPDVSTSDEVESGRASAKDGMRSRARSLLAQGHSVDVVAAVTGWSPRVVRQIADGDSA
jgi:hypothetical protein